MFDDLLAALALLLVVEGILPFLNPDALRRSLQGISQMDNRNLRIMGLVSMLCGVALLYLVR